MHRLLRLYRNYNNFLGRRRRRLKRTTQEYQQVSKDKIELMRKLTGLYKNQTRSGASSCLLGLR